MALHFLNSPAFRGHLLDWGTCIAVFVAAVLVSKTKPFERPFDPRDPSLLHPHLSDFVPNRVVILMVLLVPPAVFVLLYLGQVLRRGRTWWARLTEVHSLRGASALQSVPLSQRFLSDLHRFMLALIFTLLATKLVVDCLKQWVGRLRPDFLDRCAWDDTIQACTGDAGLVLEGRRSFPSGHASTSFAGMAFLSIWMAGWFGLYRTTEIHDDSDDDEAVDVLSRYGHGTKLTLSLLPLLPAAYVAVSR
ncbi:hypothetical protein HDU85_003152 [Gaertneriomyces sp. JEL0708]|nr:hypothetical protein HDU85_003152 [Gaertneriomyces sp. JEL0708]